MGKIEFVGIVNDFFNVDIETKSTMEMPENAHYIEEEDWIDMSNTLNWVIIGVPIFIVILLAMALKQRKNGILNKELSNEFKEKTKKEMEGKVLKTIIKRFLMIFVPFCILGILITPIHEMIHCIAGALAGLNMKFGIDPQTFIGFAYTEDPFTKAQFLVMSLAPLIILGIIPLIVLFIKYPKGKMTYEKGLKYWILTCFVGFLIISSVADAIQSYNMIKNIPNNAIVNENYWYIPE